MAGIYIHIPFCKQACTYCDFHFSTQQNGRGDMIEAIARELVLRQAEVSEKKVETIYFGGGTPSILDHEEVNKLITAVRTSYTMSDDLEITLECNPDDMSEEKLSAWFKAGVNRLSVGVQSFDDEVLTWMNRAHNSKLIAPSVELARKVGFNNLTMDLIYGIPKKDIEYWQDQLEQMIALNPDHISAYCLTIEEKTALHHQVVKNGLELPTEDDVADQFNSMVDVFAKGGIKQYEVSNFSKPGYESKHNSAYWKNTHYVGVGPSAHSFNGSVRRWNISNNPQYIKRINAGESFSDQETLSKTDQYNELLLTGLRTIWGVSEASISGISPSYLVHFLEEKKIYTAFFEQHEIGCWRLTQKGFLMADKIASDLFIVD